MAAVGENYKMTDETSWLTRTIKRYLHNVRRGTSFLSHSASLLRLKKIGFEPEVIYDVGAHRGDWTEETSKVFPNAHCFLFEANSDLIDDLRATKRRYFISALGSEDMNSKPFYLPKEGITTGASFYLENTPHYDDGNLLTRSVSMARLDTLVRENAIPFPDLIKLDIQGAEIDAMKGAPACLSHCQALITEVSLVTYNRGAPLFSDLVSWVAQRGFFCIDVCELHRYKGDRILQMDLLFVKETIFAKYCSIELAA